MKKIYDMIESIITSFLFITIIILFFFRVVSVEGASMENTLTGGDVSNGITGDRLVVSNFFYTPEKGDIVVIDKSTEFEIPIIKRVIATEGDEIKIDYLTGDVYVNNIKLDETYIKEKIEVSHSENLELTVPEGHVFVMGDNRNHSGDSRIKEIGPINCKYIVGKAVFRFYPFSEIGAL